MANGMKLTFLGDWPDAVERALLVAVLTPHIPDGDRWLLRLATGAEQVATFDPAKPWDVTPGKPLQLRTARMMRVPPRYMSWQATRPDLCFASANAALLLAQVIMWYDLGPKRIEAEVLGKKPRSA